MELLTLLESMRYHSWKYIVALDEAWFYLSIVLLIMNQFDSVQKMKLHNERVIFKDNANGHLEPIWVSLD
jgi:predicted phosphatase